MEVHKYGILLFSNSRILLLFFRSLIVVTILFVIMLRYVSIYTLLPQGLAMLGKSCKKNV